MNCFEYLGLPATHRKQPVQLVLHREDATQSKLSFPTYGQLKVDGVFAMLIVKQEGESHVGKIFSRSGRELSNTYILAQKLAGYLTEGVYFGELTSHAPHELPELSGVVNPDRVNKLDWFGEAIRSGLYMAMHDFLPTKVFISGTCQAGYLKRYEALKSRLQVFFDVASKDKPQLLELLPFTELNSEREVQNFAQHHINNGEEGAVFKQDTGWEAGHKGWRVTKIVRNLSFDLECIGFEEGKGKYEGKVANLLFRWKDGMTLTAMLGKGWTHDDAERMFSNHKEFMGKIFEVYAMEYSTKGLLRNPKAGELRHDKSCGDF